MNKLTTKKQMQMQTWWALVDARSKLRFKVNCFNFVPFLCLINFVRQRRKTKKRGKWYTNHSSNKKKKKKKVWVLLVQYF